MKAGRLKVTGRFVDGYVTGLGVCLERPPAPRLFIGQPPERVLATLPLIFGLCGQAHALAARHALAAARGEAPPAMDALPLWAESLHERLWRLLLDWPVALGLAPATDAFRRWRAARTGADLAAATEGLFAEILIGPHSDRGAPPSPDSIAGRCLARLGAAPDSPPPILDADAWLAACLDKPSATVTLAPPSAAAAYQALLAAARRDLDALRQAAPYPVAARAQGSFGAAQTLTARGLLGHGMRLECGLIRDYHMRAPTDAHFADAGCLTRVLGAAPFADPAAARRALALAILALDPCVPHELELTDA